jgi:biotin carboxyl carrier protein
MPQFDTSDELSGEHRPSGGQHERNQVQTPGAVIAPMAGRVVKLFADNGIKVKKGDAILVLEAMKMEVCCLMWSNYIHESSIWEAGGSINFQSNPR